MEGKKKTKAKKGRTKGDGGDFGGSHPEDQRNSKKLKDLNEGQVQRAAEGAMTVYATVGLGRCKGGG